MSGTPTDPRQSQRPRRARVERGIYRQPNGKYTVCFAFEGKPRFATIGFDLQQARAQRAILVAAARRGVLLRIGRLSFRKLAGLWLARLEGRVGAGVRRPRTLEAGRYHLQAHLLPGLARRPAGLITAQEIADLVEQLRLAGRSERTIAGALHTLNNILRFAVRNDWIAENPLAKLEHDERPHRVRRPPRVLGRQEITALLHACPPSSQALIATALYSGLRISELLALIWSDLDFAGATLHVRAQVSRATAGAPARREPPKTRACYRQIPLPPQLVALLAEHRERSAFASESDWVFATANGTPHWQRNAHRALAETIRRARLDQSTRRVRFHDLRHTYASHLIIDLGIDVVQVSRILGHASPETTLRVYAHTFDHARHASSLHEQIAQSQFAALLEEVENDSRRRAAASRRSEGSAALHPSRANASSRTRALPRRRKIYHTTLACSSIGGVSKTSRASLDAEMLDVRAAAVLARRNPETVRRWVWSGRLAAKRRGRRILVARADVEALAGEGLGHLSLAEWAQQAKAQRKRVGSARRGASAADLVLADRARRSALA